MGADAGGVGVNGEVPQNQNPLPKQGNQGPDPSVSGQSEANIQAQPKYDSFSPSPPVETNSSIPDENALNPQPLEENSEASRDNNETKDSFKEAGRAFAEKDRVKFLDAAISIFEKAQGTSTMIKGINLYADLSKRFPEKLIADNPDQRVAQQRIREWLVRAGELHGIDRMEKGKGGETDKALDLYKKIIEAANTRDATAYREAIGRGNYIGLTIGQDLAKAVACDLLVDNQVEALSNLYVFDPSLRQATTEFAINRKL